MRRVLAVRVGVHVGFLAVLAGVEVRAMGPGSTGMCSPAPFLGCRWLDDAAHAAWQIHVRAQFDGASPFRALRKLWELPS